MQRSTRSYRTLTLSLAFGAFLAPAALAQSSADRYFQAYYLENEEEDHAAAAELYADIAEDRRASDELRATAKTRLESCLEELQTTDFARLVPATTIAYVEINRPGDQLRELLDQLGLMGKVGQAMQETGRRLAVHPALVDSLLGVRGAAVAITGFNPQRQEPMGVMILHPGKVDVIRGAIETALPAGAEQVNSIEGYPTYNVEGEVYITLTHKLVIASPAKSEIKKVLQRLNGTEDNSLAGNPDLADALGSRGDELLFFCVNAKPVLPFAQLALASEAKNNPEMAMAMEVLDIQSLRTLVGRAGMSKEGMSFELALNLDEGHKNLVFNLLRLPGLQRDTLASIPAGSAFFTAWAMNEARPVKSGTESTYVSGMDFGREIFGNIASMALFVMPPNGDAQQASSGWPIPDGACVFTVNDTAKTQALWSMLLGLGSMASGRGAMEGDSVEVHGVTAKSYAIQEGPTIYTAVAGHEFIIASSTEALARTLETNGGGKSVLDDPAFASNMRIVSPSSTKVVFFHPGRCAEIARMYVPAHELQEAEPFLDVLDDTVISMCVEHSDHSLRFNTMVTGIPEIGHLVSAALEQELGDRHAQAAPAPRPRALPASNTAVLEDGSSECAASAAQPCETTACETAACEAAACETSSCDGGSAATVASTPCRGACPVEAFRGLATDPGSVVQAREFEGKVLAALADDPQASNTLAWQLLTEDKYGQRFTNLAWGLSKRSNEVTNFEDWRLVDTQALAEFQRGDLRRAVQLGEIALELAADDPRKGEVEAAVERFRAAFEESKAVAISGT